MEMRQSSHVYAARLVLSATTSIAIFTICSMLLWSPNATADGFFTCTPSAMIFSMFGSVSLVDDLKKISRREFGGMKMSPSGEPILARGTQINVVVDQACLQDPEKGPRSIDWLTNLRDQIRGSSGLLQTPRSYVWHLEKDWAFSDLQKAVEQEPCVQLASPNSSYQLMGLFNDPLLSKQDHLRSMHFENVLGDFIEPMLVHKRVTIAVIDSGVDFSHPELHDARWINRGEVAGNGIDDEANGYIDDVNGYNFASENGDASPQGELPEASHGTHVAGLAAARVDNGSGGAGINGVARIMSINIFGSTNTTRSVLLENAIRYAADAGADIINMSLGGREYSRTMRAALDYAIAKGSFIVTAAGNYGVEMCDDPDSFGFVSPAAYASAIDGMMVTGSVDSIDGSLSSFSNYSRRLVEITAPGAFSSGSRVGLLSTFPANGYAYLAGTSMAAPILSGTASLVVLWLKTYGYAVTPQRVEAILRQSARRNPALERFVQEGRTIDLLLLATYLKSHYPRRR